MARTQYGRTEGRQPSGNLHDKIESAIGERILSGEFMPGTVLPNEAEWGKIYNASRTAVREAIKSLTAKGLIQSRPKVGSRVEPRSRWNMLDRNVLGWHRAAMDRKAFLASTQEARRLVEPGIAELAARKHSPQQLERLVAAYHAMAEATEPPTMVATDVEFHEALLACANNELLVPFAIIIEQALTHLFDYTTNKNPHYSRALRLHQNIVRAVAAADGAAAREAMLQLLSDTDNVISASPAIRKKR
ncbi:MAG: FadR family transcriptional regulator [Rhizobiales bacterium]|nr:FadR family transcriptional regulator [Hyphomicrobiales bacterium]